MSALALSWSWIYRFQSQISCCSDWLILILQSEWNMESSNFRQFFGFAYFSSIMLTFSFLLTFSANFQLHRFNSVQTMLGLGQFCLSPCHEPFLLFSLPAWKTPPNKTSNNDMKTRYKDEKWRHHQHEQRVVNTAACCRFPLFQCGMDIFFLWLLHSWKPIVLLIVVHFVLSCTPSVSKIRLHCCQPSHSRVGQAWCDPYNF